MSSTYRLLEKKMFQSLIHPARFISGSKWGARTRSLLHLHSVLFMGLQKYSLPVINGTYKTNINVPQSLQGQVLCACPGLPKSALEAGTIAETHNLTITSYQAQETARMHFRHRAYRALDTCRVHSPIIVLRPSAITTSCTHAGRCHPRR